MTLTTGTQLGAYKILAPLGAGGMGEVWRARDTRLDRSLMSRERLEQSSFSAAESQWTRPPVCEERVAWTGTYPDQPDVPIRLEAISSGMMILPTSLQIQPLSSPVLLISVLLTRESTASCSAS